MSQFNFSAAGWLCALMVIPVIAVLYSLFDTRRVALDRLKKFADAHLLPHLMKSRQADAKRSVWPLRLWLLAWSCGVLAMAGPRWDYTDVQTVQPERALVILLDLSKSMDAQDVSPSRLARAREEIGDILDQSRGLNIGLVAFAAVPHMVAPLTDDMGTIRNFLPYLDTSLISVQGSRIKPALEMAAHLLQNVAGGDKSVLIVSDGGFSDTAAARAALPAGIHVYALGLGTHDGAPIPADGGGWIKDSGGRMVMARLEDDKLRVLADAGSGLYVTADYTDNDTKALLGRIEAGPVAGRGAPRTVRIWDERFYIPALVMALLMLPWFRRGYILPVLILLVLSAQPAQASWLDWFRNPAQQGRAAFDKGDYDTAAKKFDTPYRRGVAEYKARQFDQAAQSFAAADSVKNGADVTYNLGNAQLMTGKPEDAIKSYQAVLQQRPGDAAAAHNLEIAKKVLQQQKQQQQQQKNDQKNDQKNRQQADNQQQSGKSQQQQNSGKDSDKNQSQQSQSQQSQSQQSQSQQSQSQQSQSQQSQSQQSQSQAQASASNSEQGKTQSAQQNSANRSQLTQPSEAQNAAQPQNGNSTQIRPETPAGQKDQQPASSAQTQKQSPSGNASSQQEAQSGNQNQAEVSDQNRVQTPQDVDASQWLSRAASDPGPFLKNQFMIEARKSGAQQEDDPW